MHDFRLLGHQEVLNNFADQKSVIDTLSYHQQSQNIYVTTR